MLQKEKSICMKDKTPVEMTYENYKACASEKYLLIVPGAEHAMSYVVDKAAYETAILAFWDRYDKSVNLL